MTDLFAATVAAALSRLQTDPSAFDTVLAPHGDAGALRPSLQELLDTRQQALKADADVGLVADMLRRDQKFAPPGRPSIHLVQLRKQQASAKQAALIARQAYGRAAQDFVRALSLKITPRLTPIAVADRWMQTKLG
ncbi:MAG: hypothetical protein ABW207_06535 [Stenotrophomonas chelatiphaga]|jgi:hypothetical protein|uniref:hypothetical protein n=1 Tax=Stenotrophomonas chelatiphaga TaxID=517011 RepID=UPI000F4B20D7|nr:hypothetical protein [Stenotrophomonas chelatiphaga]MCS4231111.1 hypothetical protein [Stenotrophomonas chelatiphaga]ROQ39019.1 hypothetical protein EDF77_2840 [Stenotrophomonas maltophilia]